MVGGCVVEGAAGPGGIPQVVHVLAPASGWRIEDTWFAHGLAGSGSHHYSTKDLFVPAGHVLDLNAPSRRDEPLYRLPLTASVSIPMAGVPLGVARRALDELIALAGKKVIALPPPPVLLKNLPRVRLAVARAESLLGSARAYVYETVERLWAEVVEQGAGVGRGAAQRRSCAHPCAPGRVRDRAARVRHGRARGRLRELAARSAAARRRHDQPAPAVQRRRARGARGDGARRRRADTIRVSRAVSAPAARCRASRRTAE
jgi:alkylation response protein AidB-like acyl-CoA dehydrogenase